MKLKGKYSLDPVIEEPIRKQFLKMIGAVTLLAPLIVVISMGSRALLGQQVALFTDLLSIGALLLVVQSYSRSIAARRMEAAREARKERRFDQVVALLLPFARGGLLNTRSRFDGTGEAHYVLAQAAAEMEEWDLVRYCQFFLAKYRPGKWAKKALAIKAKP